MSHSNEITLVDFKDLGSRAVQSMAPWQMPRTVIMSESQQFVSKRAYPLFLVSPPIFVINRSWCALRNVGTNYLGWQHVVIATEFPSPAWEPEYSHGCPTKCSLPFQHPPSLYLKDSTVLKSLLILSTLSNVSHDTESETKHAYWLRQLQPWIIYWLQSRELYVWKKSRGVRS